MSTAVSIYIYHHKPSGQSRLYRVTQLHTDSVHCRESVVSKHNHCCTAAVHTVDPFFPPDLCMYKRRKFSVHGTVSYVVFQNTPGYDVLLLYILWTGFYPPDLCLSMCKEFLVHGTISYVVFQNIVITTVL